MVIKMAHLPPKTRDDAKANMARVWKESIATVRYCVWNVGVFKNQAWGFASEFQCGLFQIRLGCRNLLQLKCHLYKSYLEEDIFSSRPSKLCFGRTLPNLFE